MWVEVRATGGAMSAPEPLVLQALQGYTDQSDKWPGPRAVKIFVASVYNGKHFNRYDITCTIMTLDDVRGSICAYVHNYIYYLLVGLILIR